MALLEWKDTRNMLIMERTHEREQLLKERWQKTYDKAGLQKEIEQKHKNGLPWVPLDGIPRKRTQADVNELLAKGQTPRPKSNVKKTVLTVGGDHQWSVDRDLPPLEIEQMVPRERVVPPNGATVGVWSCANRWGGWPGQSTLGMVRPISGSPHWKNHGNGGGPQPRGARSSRSIGKATSCGGSVRASSTPRNRSRIVSQRSVQSCSTSGQLPWEKSGPRRVPSGGPSRTKLHASNSSDPVTSIVRRFNEPENRSLILTAKDAKRSGKETTKPAGPRSRPKSAGPAGLRRGAEPPLDLFKGNARTVTPRQRPQSARSRCSTPRVGDTRGRGAPDHRTMTDGLQLRVDGPSGLARASYRPLSARSDRRPADRGNARRRPDSARSKGGETDVDPSKVYTLDDDQEAEFEAALLSTLEHNLVTKYPDVAPVITKLIHGGDESWPPTARLYR